MHALVRPVWYVFSTYVEVILSICDKCLELLGFLHVCGGDPQCFKDKNYNAKFSPPMWSWSHSKGGSDKNGFVFSTYVEVILAILALTELSLCFLHVCGGDPKT